MEVLKLTLQQKEKGGSDAVSKFRDLILSASGSFASGYHLEFPASEEICQQLAERDIFTNTTNDRTYIKDSESICNLLALVGATQSLYKLNDHIAMKSVRNTTNRRANCDAANIEKQLATAAAQIEMLKTIDPESLPPELRLTLEARLGNPTATYDELAEILGISKSGVVHRIKKLSTMKSFF